MTAARKAAFAPDPRRRSMLAKVHLAKKELRLIEDDYRAMLFDATGRTSAADCTEAELGAFLDALKKKGFQPRTRAGAGAKPADSPMARKARALWISLHHLGAVRNPSEQALEAFAQRQLKVERMQWADQALGYKLIEALKAMGEREGWAQSIEGIQPRGQLIALKRGLVSAILTKLKAKGLAAREWSVAEAAWRLLGEQLDGGFLAADLQQLDRLASGFGAKLRGDA